jgi:uridylate kinase
MKYSRVLLKLSGEALGGKKGSGLDSDFLERLSSELKTVVDSGVQLALVVGGGNFFRGLSTRGANMNRVRADYIGMLGTAMNGLAIANFLEDAGVPAIVQSAVEIPRVCDLVQPLNAIKRLKQGYVVIFVGGTGNPFFTTDTTAALRASEIQADVVMKATKVDGVYDSDPVENQDAVRFDTITYDEVLERKLKVMDLTAITMCQENKMPIIVFNMTIPGNIIKALSGDALCTTVTP